MANSLLRTKESSCTPDIKPTQTVGSCASVITTLLQPLRKTWRIQSDLSIDAGNILRPYPGKMICVRHDQHSRQIESGRTHGQFCLTFGKVTGGPMFGAREDIDGPARGFARYQQVQERFVVAGTCHSGQHGHCVLQPREQWAPFAPARDQDLKAVPGEGKDFLVRMLHHLLMWPMLYLVQDGEQRPRPGLRM